MISQRNVVLVGFMGTGKTTVGKILAAKLNMSFVDMDEVIEARQKRKISAIFAENGEQFFRKLERDLVVELSRQNGLVIGTGGGIVLNPENIKDFAQSGLVVCLMAKPEIILKRLEHDNQRPLLAGGDKLEKINQILVKRLPLYNAIPHRIETSDLTAEEVANRIIKIYSQNN